ncbi:MAG: hypothetical protein HC877_23395 [Thioploca sp.]|nr:hypothetical protein [Thioploca sp.]
MDPYEQRCIEIATLANQKFPNLKIKSDDVELYESTEGCFAEIFYEGQSLIKTEGCSYDRALFHLKEKLR